MSTETETTPTDHVDDLGGWAVLWRGGNLVRSLVLSGGVALHAIYVFVVSTVLPLVVGEIGGLPYYAWVTTLFVVGSILGSAMAAIAAARFGLAGAYRLAALLFIAGTAGCAVAPTIAVFLVARTLQGLGGGLLVALAYATVRRSFPAAQRPRALAMISGIWGIAALAGPLVGGLFATYADWTWAFWSGVPVAVLFTLAVSRALPADGVMDPPPFAGLRLAMLAAAALALSIGSVPGDALSSAAGLLVAALLLVALLMADGRSAARLLPTGAFLPRTDLGAVTSTMALLALGNGTASFLPYVLQQAHGVSALTAGYVSALQAIGWTAAALVTATYSGPRVAPLLRLGPALMVAGFLGLAATIHTGIVPLIAALWSLVGIGIGVCWAHLGNLLIGLARDGERDLTAPFIATNQLMALSFGSGIAGMVANLAGLPLARGAEAITESAMWLFGFVALSPFAALWLAARPAALLRARSGGP